MAVSAALNDLSPDTRYHFRILATNATGTSEGSDETVTTTLTGSLIQQQGKKLTCARGCGGNGRVALSANGETLLVGAPDDSWGGSVAVFTRSGTTWTEQARVQPDDESNFYLEEAIGVAEFGKSLAVSADGNTTVIGGPRNFEAWGNAWVFTRSGSTWTEQYSFGPGGDGLYGSIQFGARVALSADGDTVAIGSGDFGFSGLEVFARSGTSWTQQGSIPSEFDPTGGLALSSDGDTALVGDEENGHRHAAVVYTRSGSTWTEQGEALTCAGGCDTGVALSADGNTALVGGDVFTRSGSTWTRQTTLTCGGSACGESVALAADGNTALIGTPGSNGGDGAAWLFTRSGSTWTPQNTELTASDETGDGRFGEGVALSANGDTAAITGPEDDGGIGAVWVFAQPPSPPEFGRCIKLAPEQEGTKTVYHGGFTDASCVLSSESKTGRYEWNPEVGKAPFTTTLKEGQATLETTRGTKVTCEAESASGEYSGRKDVTGVLVKFSGCESSGHKCTTLGLAEGVLETETLEGVLGWEVEARKNVALDLYPAGKKGAFMEYRCGGEATVRLTGSVLVPVTADKILVTTTLKYAASKGKQQPERLEGEPADVLTTTTASGQPLEALGLSSTSTLLNEEAVEINTVA